ncbi:hypothetical protein BCR34DRAFT_249272 [Clohesyomyces aquaticus]|uniref:Uncharacterized protein n=1 Tax=Clohesyomyces aquaticus TaxID=1231657 RepID=A0A1Y1ZUJ9_9PLEO|nr:hypothetical protein BCR34DRAFT_249272 [Clohesyomyces aquaticus]
MFLATRASTSLPTLELSAALQLGQPSESPASIPASRAVGIQILESFRAAYFMPQPRFPPNITNDSARACTYPHFRTSGRCQNTPAIFHRLLRPSIARRMPARALRRLTSSEMAPKALLSFAASAQPRRPYAPPLDMCASEYWFMSMCSFGLIHPACTSRLWPLPPQS